MILPTLKSQGGNMKGKKVFNLKTIIASESNIERYKIYEKPIIPPDNNGYTGKRGNAKNKEKSIKQAMNRAREKIHGYILANEWEYWATQTFNPEVIDRYDLDEIIRRYNKRLKNLRQRKYHNLRWLIVPEQHKDGAWHLHMFMAGIPEDRVVYSGYDYFNKSKGDKVYSRRIYNWIDTIDYGFNDYLYIGECDPIERCKIANYVTKYITKELAQKRYNKKMYWSSRGLNLPTVTNTLNYNIQRPTGIILAEDTYYIKDDDTGEIYNKVVDIITYNLSPSLS